MSTALPQGTQIAEWGGFNLHDHLSAWQDQFLGRIAQHAFDRRRGGQNEDFGEAARVTRVTLLFADAAGFADCRKFVALWVANKTRLFVHPLWGRFNATFIGIENGALTVDQGANLYTISGQFVESNINADTVASGIQSAPSKAAAASAQVYAVQQQGAKYPTALLSVLAFASTAQLFVDATLAAVTNATPNSALPGLLAGAIAGANDAIARIRLAAGDGPSAYDGVAACDVLSARLLDLGASYLAQQPPLVEYVPGEPTPLLVIANLWYPGDALNRVAQIKANNPTLIGVIVPAGFRLQMASV